MKKLVLIGGTVHLTRLLQKRLAETVFDEIIAGDSGLNWAYRLGIRPDRMMGDFDSVSPEVLAYYREQGIPMERFPARKDFTDSELALWAAMDTAGSGDELWIVGGIGSRMDHTLANVQLLYEPMRRGIQARLMDGLNEIQLLQGPADTKWEEVKELQYFSLLPFLGPAEGIDLEGFAYPLQNYTLSPGRSIGISNEILPGGGHLRLKKGCLLVIRSANDMPNPEKK